MPLVCDRKPEYLEGIHTDTGGTNSAQKGTTEWDYGLASYVELEVRIFCATKVSLFSPGYITMVTNAEYIRLFILSFYALDAMIDIFPQH